MGSRTPGCLLKTDLLPHLSGPDGGNHGKVIKTSQMMTKTSTALNIEHTLAAGLYAELIYFRITDYQYTMLNYPFTAVYISLEVSEPPV